ncbi:Fibronectin type III domain protein [hydrothermal vent metagenome]|uniref:Fibronectin type III domain protein n=1 Tax=hydrothermal vent metagenome TaxID=652676 RepID=A0A3B1E9A4_9ZZZZ
MYYMLTRNIFIVFLILLVVGCGEGESIHIQLDNQIINNNKTTQYIPGFVALGPLSGATVEIYELDKKGSEKLIYTTTSSIGDVSSAGKFKVPLFLIKDNKFYKIVAKGGEDTDKNDDGIDDGPTENNGMLRAIINSDTLHTINKINITLASEIIFQMIKNELSSSFTNSSLLKSINTKAKLILPNTKATIKDIVNFAPSINPANFNSAGVSDPSSAVLGILKGIEPNPPANTAPTISGTPTTSVDENNSYSFTPTSSDAEGDILNFSIANKPSWADFNTTTGQLSGIPDFNISNKTLNQDYSIIITVKDSSEANDTLSFTLTVNNINRAPTFTSNGIYTVIYDNKSVQNIDINVLDIDGDDINLTLETSAPTWISIFKSENNFSLNIDFTNKNNEDNNYTFDILATDGDLNTTVSHTLIVLNSYDSDGDFIPNDIEDFIGSDKLDSDENNNNVVDGKELEGDRGDQFFKYQWHLENKGLAMNDSNVSPVIGNDLNIFNTYHKYMGYNKGNRIKVHIVDTGTQMNHEDLSDNFDLINSYKIDFDNLPTISKGNDPTSVTKETHGTMVAGIVGARAFNGLGLRGVAPFVSISATNFIQDGSVYPDMLDTIWKDPNIDIFNNSWGSKEIYKRFLYEQYMESGTTTGRDRKGAIYVFAAGNGREIGDNSNFDYTTGNRFVITVAAINSHNYYSSYSTPGANNLVSAYGGEYYTTGPTIATTNIEGESYITNTWVDDTNFKYSNKMNGTSSAAPMVSGSLALVLEACPDLGWRDIKYLIAKTSTKIDVNNSSWTINSAGFNFSEDYGFGLINIQSIITECRTKNYTNLSPERNITKTYSINEELNTSDFTQNWKVYNLKVDQNITLEWIGITIDSNITSPSTFNIHIRSPNNTRIDLYNIYVNNNSIIGFPSSWLDGGHRFGTNAFMGENSMGNWEILIRNYLNREKIGYLKNIKLEMYGH